MDSKFIFVNTWKTLWLFYPGETQKRSPGPDHQGHVVERPAFHHVKIMLKSQLSDRHQPSQTDRNDVVGPVQGDDFPGCQGAGLVDLVKDPDAPGRFAHVE